VVRNELANLPVQGRAALAEAMKRHTTGESFAREVDNVGHGISELRVNVGNDHFRLLFAAQGKYSQVLLAVRVFTKKSNKLPKQDHALAIKRLKDWEQRSSD
jgi:phage-related protein